MWRDAVKFSGWLVVVAGCGVRALDPVVSNPPPDGGAGGAPSTSRDAGPAILPPAPLTCWSSQLPAQVQPLNPQAGVEDLCRTSDLTTAWTYPSDPDPSADGRANIVGRWADCSGAFGFAPVQHDGVEFGANGRWRLLAADQVGVLSGMTGSGTTGYYYLLGTGQLDVADEFASGGRVFFVTFAPGMDTIRFGDGSGNAGSIYARARPSSQNGNDNPPSISDGRCTMVGTWDVPANNGPPGAPAVWGWSRRTCAGPTSSASRASRTTWTCRATIAGVSITPPTWSSCGGCTRTWAKGRSAFTRCWLPPSPGAWIVTKSPRLNTSSSSTSSTFHFLTNSMFGYGS